MIVRYDKEKLERTIQFLLWDFINGSVRVKINEKGNLYFFKEDLKLITIYNLTSLESEILEKNNKEIQAVSGV
ncbi:MAG: hypothetical protein ACXAAM_02590 [Candidatus Heimdallarchaeaceae archaeon]|jgi:hypothetical protein